jgi:hypothetical protein
MQKEDNLRGFGGVAALAVLTAFLIFSCETPDDPPIIPQYNNVAFVSLTADGTANLTTSKLVLTFDKDIDGLATADITLTVGNTGAVKNILTKKSAGTYELSLKNITAGGMVSVSVAKSGYTVTGGPKNVTIYYKQGTGSGEGDPDIPDYLITKWYTSQPLADADSGTGTFEFTQEGKLLHMGQDNQLTITVDNNVITIYRSGAQIGTVKFNLSGTTINFSESTGEQILSTTLTFYKKGEINPIEISFNDLTQDGNSTKTTTKLTLTFDNDIDDLVVNDIILGNVTNGAVKGVLTRTGTGTYELTVSGINKVGSNNINISVVKNGYNITGGPRNVSIWGYSQTISGNTSGDFQYSYETLTQDVTITGYTGSGGNVSIPAVINNMPVTKIKDNYDQYSGVFSFKILTSIVIPNSITYIGDHAFSGCGLPSVTLSNNVTYIGEAAFFNNNLTNITIPTSLNIILDSTFDNNNLTSVIIPDNIIYIGSSAFLRNNIISVTIGENVNLGFGIFDSTGTTASGFENAYNNTYNKEKGTYTRTNSSSTTWNKVN